MIMFDSGEKQIFFSKNKGRKIYKKGKSNKFLDTSQVNSNEFWKAMKYFLSSKIYSPVILPLMIFNDLKILVLSLIIL